MVQFNRLVKQKHKFSSTIKLISNRKCIHFKEYLNNKTILTWTSGTVSSVSTVANTCERPSSICASSIGVTIVSVQSTLIIIYKEKSLLLLYPSSFTTNWKRKMGAFIIVRQVCIGEGHCHKRLNNIKWYFSPEQLVPFPVNPLLQAHVNDPAVFVQAALLSQLWVLREHSSLSKWKNDKI